MSVTMRKGKISVRCARLNHKRGCNMQQRAAALKLTPARLLQVRLQLVHLAFGLIGLVGRLRKLCLERTHLRLHLSIIDGAILAGSNDVRGCGAK